MDDASLAKLVNSAARVMLALRHDEERRDFLARLHDGVVADLRARRLDRDLARVRADMVVEAVLDATARGVPRLETTFDRLETDAGSGHGVTGIRPG